MRFMRSWFVCFLMLLCSGAFADRIRVAGTSVSLEPPAGFTKAKQFSGFAKEDITASIMVTEFPVAFEKMRKEMTKEGLDTRGMTLLSKEDNQESKPPYVLMHIGQNAAGLEFLKWMFITGDKKKTVMAVGTFLKASTAEVAEAIKKSVLSTQMETAAPKDVWEGLTFRITTSPKLKIAWKLAGALGLNASGKLPNMESPTPRQLEEPIYLVGPIMLGRIPDIKTYAEARILKTASLNTIQILSRKPFKNDRCKGYELLASANHEKTKMPMRLYQVVIESENLYYMVQGMSNKDKFAQYLPEFRRLTSTFRFIK